MNAAKMATPIPTPSEGTTSIHRNAFALADTVRRYSTRWPSRRVIDDCPERPAQHATKQHLRANDLQTHVKASCISFSFFGSILM